MHTCNVKLTFLIAYNFHIKIGCCRVKNFILRKTLLGMNKNSKSNGNVNYPKGIKFVLEKIFMNSIFFAKQSSLYLETPMKK